MKLMPKMPNWENLKVLTGSKFAQHVILVPIVGWLLVYQNTFAQILTRILGTNLQASLSWEVLVFYVGLVLLGISALIFRIFGPEAVLSHEGLQGFVDDMEAILTRGEFERFCKINHLDLPEEVTVPAAGMGQVLDATREQWLRLNSGNVRDVLSIYYRSENTGKLVVRFLITLVFLCGAVLTLVPTTVTLVWVVDQLI